MMIECWPALRRLPLRRPAVALAAALIGAAVAAPPAPAAEDAFAGFIVGLRDICAHQPARRCTGQVLAFLDADRDRRVSLVELQAAQAGAAASVGDRSSALSPVERNLLTVGLFALQQARPDAVFANFDANRDGGLSEGELFADFRLDQRPLGVIIADPAGVDWQRLAARFGKVGEMMRGLLPASQRK